MLAGGVKVIVAWLLPLVAVTPVGAPGTVDGVATAEAAEAVPVPDMLIAVTLKA